MFTGETLLDISREAFWVTLMVAGPAMMAGLAVGFVIALLQALTQVQEMTLVFVPRIIVMFLVLGLALPFMGAVLGEFALKLYAMIATGTGPVAL
ncbi:MAG: flagellar biosynthetic protein FliQ [Pseudomonadota bacterium]